MANLMELFNNKEMMMCNCTPRSNYFGQSVFMCLPKVQNTQTGRQREIKRRSSHQIMRRIVHMGGSIEVKGHNCDTPLNIN